ncbi:hypothetical protein BDV96DRAFT_524675 [Lophiotrema nucula]|uniref:RING-type domain-containing protein n=1 Tax=Lophiotrema nucula TaxID=690887 RepID=A0A6A5Z2P9_9PLEO|nr:hypothetical protein BDV96DRAFT_524675 [Lophiotrema nucula]
MGTLTADCPRLDSHCPHKLATSCRLTSTPNCCACADERPHSQTYRVYIDGVGFVQRGTRWQSYCWFCKEFWNNRIASTYPALETSQTQVPQIPNQAEFLERWLEFHQGYRTVKRADGTEERRTVIGEPLKEVSPGFLPRTLHQLRVRRPNDHTRPENRFRRARLPGEDEVPQGQEPQQSLEDALDRLLAEGSDDESDPRDAGRASQDSTAEASMPARTGATDLSRAPTRSERRLQRARERFQRVFGSREEVQQDDYQSPISSMFNRATDRYRRAEERRASGTTSAPSLDGLNERERQVIEQDILWGVMQDSPENYVQGLSERLSQEEISPYPDLLTLSTTYRIASTLSTSAPPSDDRRSHPLADYIYDAAAYNSSLRSELSLLRRRNMPPVPTATLDSQPNRPDAIPEEEMTKKVQCQVCYSQIADIAVLPCGHMVMCEWCADVVIPVKDGQHIPIGPRKCPMCRKQVKQRFKIHF